MKIAIDLTIIPDQKTGVGQYAKRLIEAMSAFDKKNQYLIFVKKNQVSDFDPKKENFRIFPCSAWLRFKILRILWEQFILPVRLEHEKTDILHSLHYTTPLFGNFRRLVTFHDMTFFLFPEKHTLAKKVYFKFFIPRSAAISDRLIAVSQNTKNDIQKIIGIPFDKIDVVYETANPIFSFKKDDLTAQAIKTRYGIKNKFILSVGTLEPRKNIAGLINAYHDLVLHKGIDCQLVIVGKKGWLYQDMFQAVKDMGLQKNIVFTDYVPDEDLVVLYNAAEIFVYPSLYEGFGIPPLEALTCGVPTITSNISSMPEVVGDGAVLIDPADSAELSRAIYELLVNEKFRAEIIKKGLMRSKIFCNEKLAQDMTAVYLRTMAS